MKVWLDDERVAPQHWVWVSTPEDVIQLLRTGKVTDLSLDNDLGLSEPREGYLVVRFLEETVYSDRTFPVLNINLHTANNIAKEKMKFGVLNLKKWAKNEFDFTQMSSIEFHTNIK